MFARHLPSVARTRLRPPLPARELALQVSGSEPATPPPRPPARPPARLSSPPLFLPLLRYIPCRVEASKRGAERACLSRGPSADAPSGAARAGEDARGAGPRFHASRPAVLSNMLATLTRKGTETTPPALASATAHHLTPRQPARLPARLPARTSHPPLLCICTALWLRLASCRTYRFAYNPYPRGVVIPVAT